MRQEEILKKEKMPERSVKKH